MTSETPTRPTAEVLSDLTMAYVEIHEALCGDDTDTCDHDRTALDAAFAELLPSGRGGEVPNQPTPPGIADVIAVHGGAVAVPEDRPAPGPKVGGRMQPIEQHPSLAGVVERIETTVHLRTDAGDLIPWPLRFLVPAAPSGVSEPSQEAGS